MNPIKILVVEDEVIVAQDIAGRLKKTGICSNSYSFFRRRSNSKS
jgi:hypothetical protein